MENRKTTTKKKKEYAKKYREDNKEKIREYMRKYQEDNKEKLKVVRAEFYEKNKEVLKERNKKYEKKSQEFYIKKNKEYYAKNKERILLQKKEYNKNNRDKIKTYKQSVITRTLEHIRNRKKVDILFKLRCKMSGHITRHVRNINIIKRERTIKIIGITYQGLKEHLESQWEPWMNWDNHGKYKKDTFDYGWDIDHIIPTSTATTIEEIYKLNHYTNLKPLCSKVNRDIKRDKV